MTLAEKLNHFNAQHDVERGEVSVFVVPADEHLTPNGECTDPATSAFADELDQATTYLDTHPYGREGGYVVFVELNDEKSWYDKNECEWT